MLAPLSLVTYEVELEGGNTTSSSSSPSSSSSSSSSSAISRANDRRADFFDGVLSGANDRRFGAGDCSRVAADFFFLADADAGAARLGESVRFFFFADEEEVDATFFFELPRSTIDKRSG